MGMMGCSLLVISHTGLLNDLFGGDIAGRKNG